MSKKKSFMNIKNIISEDIFSAFFRGLFTGKTTSKEDIDARLKAREKKFKKDIKKDVDKLNKTFAEMRADLDKQRKKRGLKPVKRKVTKITVDDVVNDVKAGRF